MGEMMYGTILKYLFSTLLTKVGAYVGEGG